MCFRVGLSQAAAGRGRSSAVEALREIELFLVGQRLVAEHQHRIAVHAGADCLDGRAVVHRAQVDRAELADEQRNRDLMASAMRTSRAYSGRIFAAVATCSHLRRSAATNARVAAGVSAMVKPPRSAQRALTSGVSSTFLATA